MNEEKEGFLDEISIPEDGETESLQKTVSKKLPWRIKISYSLVFGALELTATFWALFALHFMTNVAKLNPRYAGVIAMVYRVWDAVNDP